jgi:ubiquinone/menaquinone biosynthesis C-methylase UbiE
MSLKDVETTYNNAAPTYDMAVLNAIPDTKRLITIANLKPGNSVLDLGCGTGKLLIEAKKMVEGGEVCGVDISPGMLTIALGNIQEAGLTSQIALIHGNIADPAVLASICPAGGFDIITCLRVLGDMLDSDQLQALQLWKNYLAPSGSIVVERKHWQVASLEPIHGTTFQPGTKYALADAQTWEEADKELRSVATGAGLAVISIERTICQRGDEYVDKVGMIYNYAAEKWRKEGHNGDVDREFIEYQKEMITTKSQQSLRERGYQANVKNASVIAVLQIAEC